jgi:hypothetical protein
MPLGLCNAPMASERLMETVFRGLMSPVSYLDDVIMIGRTFQEHLLNLWKVFRWFREARLKLNLEKCQLFQKEVWYLRHTVSLNGVTTDPKMLKAIWEWLTPKNKH